VLKAAGIEIGDAVDVREESGRIVVALHAVCGDIADLVAKITPDNLHDPVDFGPSIGREQL
jgi:antitoxin component of MazEF toxin-antitoxin module